MMERLRGVLPALSSQLSALSFQFHAQASSEASNHTPDRYRRRRKSPIRRACDKAQS